MKQQTPPLTILAFAIIAGQVGLWRATYEPSIWMGLLGAGMVVASYILGQQGVVGEVISGLRLMARDARRAVGRPRRTVDPDLQHHLRPTTRSSSSRTPNP